MKIIFVLIIITFVQSTPTSLDLSDCTQYSQEDCSTKSFQGCPYCVWCMKNNNFSSCINQRQTCDGTVLTDIKDCGSEQENLTILIVICSVLFGICLFCCGVVFFTNNWACFKLKEKTETPTITHITSTINYQSIP